MCKAVHSHERGGELTDTIKQGTAAVAQYNGHIAAYASAIGFFGHAVGRTNYALQALIASAPFFLGPCIIAPTRTAALFRWCLLVTRAGGEFKMWDTVSFWIVGKPEVIQKRGSR